MVTVVHSVRACVCVGMYIYIYIYIQYAQVHFDPIGISSMIFIPAYTYLVFFFLFVRFFHLLLPDIMMHSYAEV